MDKEEQAATAMKQLIESRSEDLDKGIQGIIGNIFTKGMVPKDALGIDDTSMEQWYSQAYLLYNSGRYVDASKLFRLLILLNMTESKYALGLAACMHMLKEYRNAVRAYINCSLIDPANPIPQYHASDCFIEMGDKLSAIAMLEMAIKRAGDKPQYSFIKERSTMTLERLKNELKAK